MAEPNVIPTAEAARLLGVTTARIRQLVASGELGTVQFAAGGWLVTMSSVKRLLAEKELQNRGNKQ